MRAFAGAAGLVVLAGLVAGQEECLSLTTLFPECAVGLRTAIIRKRSKQYSLRVLSRLALK